LVTTTAGEIMAAKIEDSKSKHPQLIFGSQNTLRRSRNTNSQLAGLQVEQNS